MEVSGAVITTSRLQKFVHHIPAEDHYWSSPRSLRTYHRAEVRHPDFTLPYLQQLSYRT